MFTLTLRASALAALLLTMTLPAIAQERTMPGIAARADDSFHPIVLRLDRDPVGTMLVQETSPEFTDANFLRVRLQVVAPRELAGARLVVADGFDTEVESFDLAGPAGVRELWTKLIPGRRFIVRVIGARQPEGSTVLVRDVVRDVEPIQPLSLVGGDQRQKITAITDPAVLSAARATARLVYQHGTDSYACTAFLIGATRMITNQHCLEDASACASIVLEFDFDSGKVGLPVNQRRCAAVRAIDYALDFAVFDLDRAPPTGITPLAFATSAPPANTALLVVEHPAGEAKQISKVDCTVRGNPVNGRGTNTDFTHGCDTLGGSSGSSLVDASFKVVGVHHLGTGNDQPQFNRAVRIELIAARMKALGLLP